MRLLLLLLLLLSMLLLGFARWLNKALTKISTRRNAAGLLQPFASALTEINRFKENKLFIMDQITTSAAMNICIEQKHGLDGLSFYNDLLNERRIDVQPDRITYGMAMSCCVLTSNAVLANTLLAQCDSYFSFGSSLKYRDQDLCILAMCMAANALVNDWATITAHFKMLTKTRGMQPSASILESALRACKNTQDHAQWKVVESYIDVLQADGGSTQKLLRRRAPSPPSSSLSWWPRPSPFTPCYCDTLDVRGTARLHFAITPTWFQRDFSPTEW